MKKSVHEIVDAFSSLKQQLATRDYDDELFLKDLPEKEPVSLVIPFERSGEGYVNVFRSYIGGDKTPELSDEDVLFNYLQANGRDDPLFSDISAYSPQFFRGCIEENEARGGQIFHGNAIHENIIKDYPEFDSLSRFEQRPILGQYYNDYWNNYTPKTVLNEEEQIKLVSLLKSAGLRVCTEKDKEAADTSYFVVMPNGIFTPFMEQEILNRRLPQIKGCMKQCGMNVGGHISPVSLEQLREPQTDIVNNKKEKIETYYDILEDVQKNNIEDVKEKVCSDTGSLYRGGILGLKGFTANIDISPQVPHCLRKSYAMATKDAEYALRYACSGSVLDLRDVQTNASYGFLYKYSRKGDETYFADRGIERAPSTAILPAGDEVETPVFPHKNKLKEIYLVSRKVAGDKTETKVFPLDRDNPLHKKFLELHNPQDTRVTGYLKERRLNQIEEAQERRGVPKVFGLTVNEEKIREMKGRLGTKKHAPCPLTLKKSRERVD